MVQKTLNYFRVPKKLFWGLIFLVIIILLFKVFEEKSLEVDVGAVKMQNFQTFIIDEGMTHYKNRRIITAPADGINPALELEIGDKVKKNQILYHFIWDKNIPIVSPLDGVILKIFERDRRAVVRGTPLIEVGDPKSLEIVAPLLSEEVVTVKSGQRAIISKWGGTEFLEAKVDRVNPTAFEVISALGVKEQRVNVYLTLDLKDNLLRLGDGFRLEVKIIKKERQNILTVPIGSLFRKQDKTALFIIDMKSRARLRFVEIGERNQDVAEVLSDLEEGVKVILYPSSQIIDGANIKIRKEY